MFKKGDKVTQVVAAAITGEVIGFALDQESGQVQAMVEYTDPAGEVHTRFFEQSELVATPETVAVPEVLATE